MKQTPQQADREMDAPALGRRIRYARRAAGRTQAEVCRHLGLSRPTYIAVENGTRGASAAEVISLANFFGVQVSSLVADVVSRRLDRSPLLQAADLCEWVEKLDRGAISEGQFARFVAVDRVTARVVAEACRAMARVITGELTAHAEFEKQRA